MKFHTLLACTLAVLVPVACATSSDTDTNEGSTSNNNGGNGAGTSNGGNATGGNATGGNATGGNATGGNAMGGNAMGGNAMGGNAMGGNGAGGGPTCPPMGDCEICAESQCSNDWDTCCATVGCIALSRCVVAQCNADVFDLMCIQGSCAVELGAAGGLGGPGTNAGLALGQCLDTTLMAPPTPECTACAQANP